MYVGTKIFIYLVISINLLISVCKTIKKKKFKNLSCARVCECVFTIQRIIHFK